MTVWPKMLVIRLFPLVLVAVCFVGHCATRLLSDQTKFYFFYGPTYFDRRIYNYNALDEILQHEKYDANKTTVLYIHGYLESPESDSVRLIVNAYHTRNEHNLIVLDWAEAAYGDYFINAVPNSITLGNILSTVVLSTFKKGLDSEKFHVVAHSLGAQLAGVMGRKIISKSNQSQKLKRVTGLDSANPPFFPALLLNHLSHSDAEYVDIIHTDAGLYGQPIATGTIDFWPNGGTTLQPGCPFRLGIPLSVNDLCSHQRSVKYFAESVATSKGTTFQAVSAKSWSRFKVGDTNTSNVVNMGIDCSTSTFGDYYLQTNGEPPFSRGANGLRYLN